MYISSSSVSESCPYLLHSRYSLERQSSSESARARTEPSPSHKCAWQRARQRRWCTSPIHQSLAIWTPCPLPAHPPISQLGLLELGNQFERLDVATSKGRKMQRERVASAQSLCRCCAEVRRMSSVWLSRSGWADRSRDNIGRERKYAGGS